MDIVKVHGVPERNYMKAGMLYNAYIPVLKSCFPVCRYSKVPACLVGETKGSQSQSVSALTWTLLA